MVLDIGHSRAALINPDEGSLFCNGIILSEFRGFNVPVSYFDPFIQDVQTADLVKELVIPKDIKYYDWICRECRYSRKHYVIFPVSESYIEKKVQEFDKEFGNDDLVRKEYKSQLSRRTITYYKRKICKGFYIESFGSQRNGMGIKFNKFINPDIFNWAGMQHFKEAYEAIEFNETLHDTYEEYQCRLINFKENFIDSYKEGASFMVVSR